MNLAIAEEEAIDALAENDRRIFLGVDGGQTSTVALIGDGAGRVLGVGHAGPCNIVGEEDEHSRFVEAIRGAVDGALGDAGRDQSGRRFQAACLGLSGGPAERRAWIEEVVDAGKLMVTHDAEIALVGATGGKPGIIAIAGTGSIAFGRNADGRTARAGGWGYVFGDEGSAFDLVRQAVRAALRQEEGWGPKTALRDALVSATSASTANELLHRFYTPEYTRTRIAALSRLVEQIARDGDPIARDILMQAAQSLATLVAAVRGQLFRSSSTPNQEHAETVAVSSVENEETVPVSYGGGVFQSALLRERFQMLVELEGSSKVARPLYGPAAGALTEAYRLVGVKCELHGEGIHL